MFFGLDHDAHLTGSKSSIEINEPPEVLHGVPESSHIHTASVQGTNTLSHSSCERFPYLELQPVL